MDFFTVPTVTFSLLYCCRRCRSVSAMMWSSRSRRDRRRILHCNVTKHPTSLWIVQQLREAFPFDSARRFCGLGPVDEITGNNE